MEGCGHFVELQKIKQNIRNGNLPNDVCVICELTRVEEAKARAEGGENFNLVEYRLAKNKASLEELLLASGTDPIPADYIDFRIQLKERQFLRLNLAAMQCNAGYIDMANFVLTIPRGHVQDSVQVAETLPELDSTEVDTEERSMDIPGGGNEDNDQGNQGNPDVDFHPTNMNM